MASDTRRIAAPAPAAWRFVREAVRDFRTTGAVAPSSRHLASRLADPLRRRSGLPTDVLEVGAGTGAVTRALLPLLGPGSRLDVVESNPRFAAGLQDLLDSDPHLAAAGVRAVLHRTGIENLRTDERYDVIVSGLPLTNFAPGRVAALMDHYCRLLRPGGTLTYFTYRGTGIARSVTASRREAARHREVERVLASRRAQVQAGAGTVWANVPPARVWTMTAPAPVAPGAETPVQKS
ncbi:methyltransferase domain-containing protein [Streptomyces bambusae]|uniref:class I SAM-dependent methyltransferase n=1 Tax=Streptomyces bambusae TaxID=1550616 RepID=UPI001CFCED04|nr:methyltransferase [Streptomyces bambusae]MCB5164660.1 methyltransferase domain-containing protein [Streptomyces bambusae]